MNAKLAVLIGLLFSGCAGQPFADLYFGGTFPEFKADGESVDLDPAFTVGGRGGYYFHTGIPVEPGLGLDISATFLNVEGGEGEVDTDATLYDVSPLLFVRGFPEFWIQPYGAVGPAAVVLTNGGSETDVGLDFRAGAAVKVYETAPGSFSPLPFLEYRLVYLEQEYDFGFFEVDTEEIFHSVLVGLSARF